MDNNDTLSVIFSLIDCGSDYKSILFTCQRFRDIVQKVHPTADEKFANHLLTLLKLYPDAPWNYDWLSRNPNITADYVQAQFDKPWNRALLELNLGIAVRAPANCSSDSITWDDMPDLEAYAASDWDVIPTCPNIPWDWESLCVNPNITWNIIVNIHIEMIHDPITTWKMVRDDPELQDFKHLSRNAFRK